MKPIRIIVHHQVIIGYLIDEENSILFDNGQVWLTRVKGKGNELFEVTTNMSLLGDIPEINYPLEDYAKKLVKHLKNTSLFSYLVQKHYYSDQPYDWEVTNI